MWNKIKYFSIQTIINKSQWWKRCILFYMKNGITTEAAWNTNTWIAKKIWPKLLYFYRHHSTFPATLDTFEEWDEILYEIVWTYREIAKEFPNEPQITLQDGTSNKVEYKRYYERIDNGLYLYAEYQHCLWT